MPRRIRDGSNSNVVNGTGGNDTLSGLDGSFELVGGKGDDTYIVDDPGDTVVEKNRGGTDLVLSYINYELQADVENLTLVGVNDIAGYGNSADNTMIGNSGANILSGFGGDDVLDGGAGDDTLAGGDGSDVLDGGDGSDTAVFDGALGDYVFQSDGTDLLVTYAGGGTDLLRNIEYLAFDDVVIAAADVTGTGPGDPPPPLPEAADDTADGVEDETVVISVLDNDSGDSLSVTSVSDGAMGQVTSNGDGTLTYRPDANANGTDSFTYTVTDSLGRTTSATVTVNIASVNDNPVALGESYSAPAGEPFTSPASVLANDTDADGDTLTVTAFDAVSAAGGSVAMAADGTFTYTPGSGFAGLDSFTYTVSDGHGGEASTTVLLTVGGGGAPDYALEALLPGGTGDSAYRWNSGDPLGTAVTVTFSFLDAVPDYYSADAPERVGFVAFDADQQAAVREALALIEAMTNITFVEVTDSAGQITFGMADLPGGSGWAYLPSTLSATGGDVWLDSRVADNFDLSAGGDGFKTLLHELGHALGLEHPTTEGDYPESELNRKYTVMSYAQHPDVLGAEPSTYMLYDIAALQHLYGVNETATAGDDIYDLSNVDGLVSTIWDVGGWDVLDAASSTRAVVLDLNQGAYSTSGTTYGWYPAQDNIAIAYGTVIEEARGGAGDDVIVSNAADNLLSGGAGADSFVFDTGWGSDVISDFEDGVDVIDFSAVGIGFADLDLAEIDGSATIGFGADLLTLSGVSLTAIDETDFVFSALV